MTSGAVDRCHRCLQPAPIRARRCPHCGDRLTTSFRRLSLYVAAGMIFGVLALVAYSLYLKPAVVNLDNIPEAEREQQQQSRPPKPVKKPPLN